MTIAELQKQIAAGEVEAFYVSTQWKKLRRLVLNMDRFECQRCKVEKHRYRRATIVHHVKHLKDRPDLALEIWDGKERQLISVCKECHEDLHPESQRQYRNIRAPLTPERWD